MTIAEISVLSNGVLYILLGTMFTTVSARFQNRLWSSMLSGLVCYWFGILFFLQGTGTIGSSEYVFWAYRIGVWVFCLSCGWTLHLLTSAEKRKIP